MKTTPILYAAIAFILCISGCKMNTVTGSGNIISESPTVSPFEEIEVATHCDVTIYQGSEFKVEAREFSNLMQYLKFEVVGKKLTIKTVPDNMSINNSQAAAVIYMPDLLRTLTVSGSGNIVLSAGFKDITDLNVSGSGNIKGTVPAAMNNIHATIEGSGDITITGTANNLDLSIEGSGNIDFANVKAQTATCSIDGSGDITVNAANTLSASINGSGDILYYGNPVVSQKINGSGRVVKR